MLWEEKRKAEAKRKPAVDPDYPSVVIFENRDSTLIDDEMFITRKPYFVLEDDINW